MAFGVKPKNLKALGPENACPILAVVRRLMKVGNLVRGLM